MSQIVGRQQTTSLTPTSPGRCPFEYFHGGELVPEDWPVQPTTPDGLAQNPSMRAHIEAWHSVVTFSRDWMRNYWHKHSDGSFQIYDSSFLEGGEEEDPECQDCGRTLTVDIYEEVEGQ